MTNRRPTDDQQIYVHYIRMLTKAQLRWSGHIVRMGDERLPKRLLYGELVEGKRSAGGQRKRYKDRLNVSLNKFSIDTDIWEDAATDRPECRSLIAEGAINFEQQRLTGIPKRALTRDPTGAEGKRRQRKSFSISSSSSYLCRLWENFSRCHRTVQPQENSPWQCRRT